MNQTFHLHSLLFLVYSLSYIQGFITKNTRLYNHFNTQHIHSFPRLLSNSPNIQENRRSPQYYTTASHLLSDSYIPSALYAKSLYELTLLDEEFVEDDELTDEMEEDLKHFNDTFISKPVSKMNFNGKEAKIKNFLRLLVSQELRDDIVRRKPHYISDWLDGFIQWKVSLPAIIFLYFSCMAPVISFGTIASQITEGSIGVLEFFLASGGAGMAYAVLAGQPMAFIAPTGLTLAFISGLFRFCQIRNLPFFPIYSWVGLWTSLFMTLLGLGGSSKLIRYCTRFTDEIFNGLLSVNFIYEAYRSLKRNFDISDPNNLSMPFLSLSMALGTFISTTKLVRFETSKFFTQKIRTTVKDFGPSLVIIFFSMLNNLDWIKKFHVPTLQVSDTFQLAGGRSLFIPILSVSSDVRLLCMFPAILLTALFFMDQNISVRVVNNPERKLKKGPGYNIDMVALGFITAVLSVFGLPWMCGATVQTVNHMRSMTKNKYNPVTEKLEIDSVVETRTTGFVVHAMLASTVKLLPMLAYLPIPVVSGVFLYLGRKLMTGNTFLKRIRDTFAEKKRLPFGHPVHVIGRKKVNIFTALQICCLWMLWGFKQNPNTAMFFPGAIGVLIAIRLLLLPQFFSEKELVALGDPTP